MFGEFTSSIGGLAVGHFNPGAVGGPNSSQGFDGGGGANSWDYLLAVEGCLLFAGAVARRYGTDSAGRAAYPFCVEAVPVGYASESEKEAAESTRAELWLPLWQSKVTLAELSHLFAEGRAQLGRRQARNAVEFALALASLGVSRGFDSFVRYAFVKRNGLSYFAAPLGRVEVQPRLHARLLDDPPLADWVQKLRESCRDKDKTPARYQTALRQIDRAMFEFANRSEHGNEAKYLLDVLSRPRQGGADTGQRAGLLQGQVHPPVAGAEPAVADRCGARAKSGGNSDWQPVSRRSSPNPRPISAPCVPIWSRCNKKASGRTGRQARPQPCGPTAHSPTTLPPC